MYRPCNGSLEAWFNNVLADNWKLSSVSIQPFAKENQVSKRYPVVLASTGVSYSHSMQTEPRMHNQWQRIIQTARSNREHFICGCLPAQVNKLAPRQKPKSEECFLASYPNTTGNHAMDCFFYATPNEDSGLQAYNKGVVEETEEGDLKIKLAFSLRPSETKKGTGSPELSKSYREPGMSKSAIRLRGLFDLLWTRSKYNTWMPAMKGKRNHVGLHKHLLECAERIMVGNDVLSQHLLVASPVDDQVERNLQIMDRAIVQNERLVVVAELPAFEKWPDPLKRLPLMFHWSLPYIGLEDRLWDLTVQRFNREIAALRRGERVMVIVQTDVPTKGKKLTFAKPLHIALRQINNDLIPVDSTYERQIADKLIDEGRQFEKPLRYDAEDEKYAPDFILCDTAAGRLPMEVFGLLTPEYIEQKALKSRHYDGLYGAGRWWQWNAAVDDPIPEFPAVK